MSRRKQAKPRSLKRDEEWDEGTEPPEAFEEGSNLETVKPDDDDDEEEELQRAFSRHSEDYLRDPPSVRDEPEVENQNSLDSDVLGTGSSSWHSEDGAPNARRGGETPSSCATPTSASFPSEPEVDAENGLNADGNNPAPYPCQFCDRTFPRLSYLKKHEQSHGDQMPYRCSWCARLFKHKRSRDRHVKLHTGDRRYRCSHCEAAFSRSDHLKIHMKTHDNQKPYQCTACSRGYNTAAALTSHMQSHKKNQSPGHSAKMDLDYGRRSVSSHSASSPPTPISPCPSFGLSLNPKNSLKSQQQQSAYLNNSNSTPTTPVLSSPLKLACMYCTRDSFTSMQQLQIHVNAMHQSILNGENLALPSPGYNIQETPNSRSREPDKFERSARRDSDAAYRREDREKSGERERAGDISENAFSCGQCTMKFSNLSHLRDHLMTIHRNDGFGSTLMMCPLCGVPCASAASYAEHYVLQHSENQSRISSSAKDPIRRGWDDAKSNGIGRDGLRVGSTITARACEIGTAEPADLTKKQQHSRTGDSRYSAGTLLCGQCGAALKDFESFREHLARHLQADHQGNGLIAPRNPCPKCDAVFPEREDMIAHLTKHYLGQTSKEYACGACKKCYPHPDLLQRHLLDTHAHHLYRCALCRDTFDSRVAIQVHFAVKHSQECRIYRCAACSVSNNENSPGNAQVEGKTFFRSEAEMTNHVRTVHAPSGRNESPAPRSRASTPGIAANSPRCVFCGVGCNTDLELQLHLASHSTSLYRCPICREGFPVEFLLDRHIAQAHHVAGQRNDGRENGRSHRASRSQDDTAKSQKRGRSPASSNNNSLNQRDNNTKRLNYGPPTNGANPLTSAQHPCELCERGEFATEAELQAHKKLVHTPAKLPSKSLSSLSMTCAYCGEVCRSRGELESHTRIQHASSEPGGRHKCNICDEVCPSGGILAEHKLQKHCKIQVSDCCIVCRGSIASEAQFMEHLQRHNLEGADAQQRLDGAVGHLPAACVVCRQTLISDLECRLHARHHLRGTSGFQSANSSPSPNHPKIQQQPQTQSQMQAALSCCLCLREFGTEEFVSLPTNPAGTGGPSLRVCKSCYVRHSQGLPILSSPYEHARPSNSEKLVWTTADKEQASWEASGEPWDTEQLCKADKNGRSAAAASSKDSADNRCEESGIKFENFDEAENHRAKEHAKNCRNSNTYTCIQCQMSFPSEEKIQQHVRKEHLESPNESSMEALRCHLCHFEASSPFQLQGHLIEHTFAGCAGLTCYICQALFTTSTALQNHMLQQHGLGARPYDCSYCTSKFFFRIELDHHSVTVHRLRESPSLSADAAAQNAAVDNDVERPATSAAVTVKEEVANSPEDEDVDVDDDNDDVERPDDKSTESECNQQRHLVDAKEESFGATSADDKIEC